MSLCWLDTQAVPCSAFMLLANELGRDVVQVSIGRDVCRGLTAVGERHCVNYKHLLKKDDLSERQHCKKSAGVSAFLPVQ